MMGLQCSVAPGSPEKLFVYLRKTASLRGKIISQSGSASELLYTVTVVLSAFSGTHSWGRGCRNRAGVQPARVHAPWMYDVGTVVAEKTPLKLENIFGKSLNLQDSIFFMHFWGGSLAVRLTSGKTTIYSV